MDDVRMRDDSFDLLDAFPTIRPPHKQEISQALTQAAAVAATSAAAAAAPPVPPAATIAKRLRTGSIRSEAVVAGGVVYICGQTALPTSSQETEVPQDTQSGAEEGEDRGMGTGAEEQATKALEKVKGLLEEAGSSVSKVLAVTFYVKDVGEDLEGVNAAWGRWIDKGSVPARTIVQTGAGGGGVGSSMGELGKQEVRVEIQATAHL